MLRVLTIAYCACLATIVIGADLGVLKPLFERIHMVPLGDKMCHFVFVGTLSFLISATLSMRLQRFKKRTVVFSTIAVLVVLTSLEELSHSMLPTRRYSELDMLCNISGACIFGMFALLLPIPIMTPDKRTLA